MDQSLPERDRMNTPDMFFNLIKPNVEAAAFIRGKTPVSRAVFDKMLPELKARCFVITGIENANAIQSVRDKIATLPEGADWNEVKKEIAATMSPWLDEESAAKRADLLVRFHGFQAYQATQWNLDQQTKDTHPYYLYRTAQDDAVRDSHAALDGIILPIDDPFWQTHYPPWDWGCRCELIAISEDDVQAVREEDAKRPPDERHVIEGSRLDQLHDGWIINGPAARIDVRSDFERGNPGAFKWNPGDLRISPEELSSRYDADVWSGFRKWAEITAVDEAETISVWEWMNGSKLADPSAPVHLVKAAAETIDTAFSAAGVSGKTSWSKDEIKALWREMKEDAPFTSKDILSSVAGAKANGNFSEARIHTFVNQALSIMPRDLVSSLGKLNIRISNTIRGGALASFDESTNTISLAWKTISAHGLGPAVVRERIFHEMGHWVHMKGPKWYRDEITRLFEIRTAGEKKTISQLYGVPVKRDKWYDEYAGREYGMSYKGLEVVTRHFQLLGNPERMAFLMDKANNAHTISENLRTVLSVFYKVQP